MTSFEYMRIGGDVAAAGVRQLRRTAGANEVSKTELANRLGMRRQTVSSHFGKGDMSLSEFTALALALGRRPSDLMASAENSIGIPPTPALADAMCQTEQEAQ